MNKKKKCSKNPKLSIKIPCDFFVKQILEYIMDSATVPRPVTGGDES